MLAGLLISKWLVSEHKQKDDKLKLIIVTHKLVMIDRRGHQFESPEVEKSHAHTRATMTLEVLSNLHNK